MNETTPTSTPASKETVAVGPPSMVPPSIIPDLPKSSSIAPEPPKPSISRTTLPLPNQFLPPQRAPLGISDMPMPSVAPPQASVKVPMGPPPLPPSVQSSASASPPTPAPMSFPSSMPSPSAAPPAPMPMARTWEPPSFPTASKSALPLGIAPESGEEPDTIELHPTTTPAPVLKRGLISSLIWDVIRPTRLKIAMIAGAGSLLGTSYALNEFLPNPSPPSGKPTKSEFVQLGSDSQNSVPLPKAPLAKPQLFEEHSELIAPAPAPVAKPEELAMLDPTRKPRIEISTEPYPTQPENPPTDLVPASSTTQPNEVTPIQLTGGQVPVPTATPPALPELPPLPTNSTPSPSPLPPLPAPSASPVSPPAGTPSAPTLPELPPVAPVGNPASALPPVTELPPLEKPSEVVLTPLPEVKPSLEPAKPVDLNPVVVTPTGTLTDLPKPVDLQPLPGMEPPAPSTTLPPVGSLPLPGPSGMETPATQPLPITPTGSLPLEVPPSNPVELKPVAELPVEPTPSVTPLPPVNEVPAKTDPTILPGASTTPPNEAVTPEAKEPITNYDVDLHRPKNGDTYSSLSERYYSSAKYAAALQMYNRGVALGQLQEVQIPPVPVIREYAERSGALPVPGLQNPIQPVGGQTPAPEKLQWTNPQGRAPEVKYDTYRVSRPGMTLKDVAKIHFGTDQAWTKLNTGRNRPFAADQELPVGTELVVPLETLNWR